MSLPAPKDAPSALLGTAPQAAALRPAAKTDADAVARKILLLPGKTLRRDLRVLFSSCVPRRREVY
ncbi:hypothetical protein D4A47_11770 [Anaerotruncus massiliensis (ex Liu et al. 2021)]|uniref:Uncharacterized protein n=1 Tax=Anaerotruncus massiliensis (ex Liu et al. 2021) TaxID=2321404 RepID=A0A498CWI4_9FIRM|nr:hypothetical protein D4A47_11770 [Anaerotruncus massiliensis (ex Liu et al. 2021)]